MRWYSMVCMQKTGAGGNVARRLRWPCRRHGARGRGAGAWDGGEGLTEQAGLGEGPAWGRRASTACTVLGAACLWAWGYVANLSAALFPEPGVVDSIGIEYAYYTSQCALVACALLVAFVLRRRQPALPPALVVGSGVALGLASAAVAGLMRSPDAPVAAVAACGVVYGVCGLVLTVAWGARFTLGAGGARRLVLLSFLLAYALYLVSNALPAGASGVRACALPLASALLWLLDSWRRHRLGGEVWPEGPGAGSGGATLGEASAGAVDPDLLPWRAMGLFAVAALVGNFVSSFLMGATYQGAAVIFPAGFFVCAVIAAAALGLAGSQEGGTLSAERLFRYCLPFSVLGMLMLLVAPAGQEGFPGALVVGASLFLQVLVVLVVTQATQESGISPLLSFSAGQGVVGAVVFAGNVGGRAASAVEGAAGSWLPLVCAGGVFVLFYMLVMVTDGMAGRLAERGLRWDVEAAPDARQGGCSPLGGLVADVHELAGASESAGARASGAAAAGVDGAADAGDARLSDFACRLGLTPREQEVCRYLVQGRSLPYIAEQLFVTPGTVKTHALHIYRKAGVSSKQDLISLYAASGGVR